MKVTIYGSGYVGLVTGACLAQVGNQVLCVDIDERKVKMLQSGNIPIYEPGLDEMIKQNLSAGRIKFTQDAADGVKHGLFQFISVGTPPDEDGSADLSHVVTVAHSIAQHMSEYRVIVTKSTVPVGTADIVKKEVTDTLKATGKECEFSVVSNPEFLKEGAAVTDFMRPDRIIVGTNNPRTGELFRTLYDPFTRNRDRLIMMDVNSAELTKYAANAMLATKISFMNEVANVAEKVGADIEQVRLGIGADPRIGYHFIYPGCGFGGSCFPKDVKALIGSAAEVGNDMQLLKAVRDVNEKQKHVLFGKIERYFKGDLKGKTIALWGLAFKPNTDDLREAPSIDLLESLWAAGARVRAYDPVAGANARVMFENRNDLDIVSSAMEALDGSDALALVTEWTEFRSPDFAKMSELLSSPVIFDGRNVYEPSMMSKHGFTYFGIGRGERV